MLAENRIPTHPGEILCEMYLRPLGLSLAELAERVGIPEPSILEIVNGRRGVTPETARLLAREFDTTAQFWLNLQATHDSTLKRSETVERPAIPESHRGEIDRRLADLEAHPGDGSPWEEVRARLAQLDRKKID